MNVKAFGYKMYRKPKHKELHRLVNLHARLYNHCIALHKHWYCLTGKHLPAARLMRHITRLKTREPFAWLWEIGSQSAQDVVQRIDRGYALYFSEHKKGNKKIRPPTFKKARDYHSFTLKQSGWKLVADNIVRIAGRTHKFALSRPIEGKIKTVTIKRDRVGDFYVYFACEVTQKPALPKTGETVGIDFGLKTFLTLSDGTSVQSPRFAQRANKISAQAHRNLAHKRKGSHNRRKARVALARVERKITRQRNDWQWKRAHEIAKRFDTVWIENLNLPAMKALWGRKVSDLAYGSFVRKLGHLLVAHGKTLGKRDRFLASSKTHFECGYVNKALTLNDRFWICQCGEVVDRDRNAALMIEHGRSRSWEVGDVRHDASRAVTVDLQESPRSGAGSAQRCTNLPTCQFTDLPTYRFLVYTPETWDTHSDIPDKGSMAKKAGKAADEFITIKEAAQILEVYEKTVSNWFDKGVIEGKKTILGTRKPLRSSVMKIRKRLEGGWQPRDDA